MERNPLSDQRACSRDIFNAENKKWKTIIIIILIRMLKKQAGLRQNVTMPLSSSQPRHVFLCAGGRAKNRGRGSCAVTPPWTTSLTFLSRSSVAEVNRRLPGCLLKSLYNTNQLLNWPTLLISSSWDLSFVFKVSCFSVYLQQFGTVMVPKMHHPMQNKLFESQLQ